MGFGFESNAEAELVPLNGQFFMSKILIYTCQRPGLGVWVRLSTDGWSMTGRFRKSGKGSPRNTLAGFFTARVLEWYIKQKERF